MTCRRRGVLSLLVVTGVLVLAGCPLREAGDERDADGRPLLDRSRPGQVCEVHGKPLQEDRVRIDYGLIKITKEAREAREKHFPNAMSRLLGGCDKRPPRTAKVSYCPDCRQAEAAWKAKHVEEE